MRVITSDDMTKVIPDPYYGPAFHDQPILAHREGALRRRAGGGRARRRSAHRRAGGAADQRRIRGTAGGLRRGRGVDQRRPSCTTAQAGRHFRRPQAPQGRARTPISRSTIGCAAATSIRPMPPPSTSSSTTFKTQKVLHLPFEPFACIGDYARRPASPSTPPRRGRRSCGSRSRACWAGRRTGCASRCRISAAATAPSSTSSSRRWSLALSLIVRRPVKVALTMEEQFYHDHQASEHVPHQERRRQGRPDRRAQMRGVLERRRLCRHRSARHAESPASPRPAPTTSTTFAVDSYALYTNLTPAGALRGFGVPQLVWAYEGHMDMMARALSIDPMEFRRKNLLHEGRAARHRHDARGRADRESDGQGARAHELVGAVRQGLGRGATRPRLRHRASRR